MSKIRLTPGLGNLIYWSLPVLYFLIFGPVGFTETDQGFIQGLSYRILEGEVIYRDFIYVRPPLSPYLHALELALLPENLGLLGSRLVFYLMMAGGIKMGWQGLRRLLGENFPIKMDLWVLLPAFVLSVHNYPPMPWHTVDGIFFAGLAIYLMSFKSARMAIPALVAGYLAALAKQPFYVIPLVLLVLALVRHKWTGLIYAAGTLIFSMGLFTWLLFHLDPELPLLFLEQTSGATKFTDLLNTGFTNYLRSLAVIVPLIGIGYYVVQKLDKDKSGPVRFSLAAIFILILSGLMVMGLLESIGREEFRMPGPEYPQILFWAGIFCGLLWIREKRPEAGFFLLGMSGISWAASISWGYATPALFLLPGWVGLVGLLAHLLSPRTLVRICMGFSFFSILVFAGMYQFPYRDAPAGETEYLASTIFPKMTGIRTGEQNYGKLSELKYLLEGRQNYAVFPSHPLAYYLLDDAPSFPVDWAHNAEMLWSQNEKMLTEKVNSDLEFILIEKDKVQEIRREGRYGSEIAAMVMDNWTLGYTGEFYLFYIQENP